MEHFLNKGPFTSVLLGNFLNFSEELFVMKTLTDFFDALPKQQ